jgi:glycosyltransferase involved in cell wall biosynthesis
MITENTIALIIPYYNGSDYIEAAIGSAFSQTLPFHEVIVVDDGSKESESLLLEALLEKYPFTYIKQENGGQGSARNAGCHLAVSDYVCFLDQDDVLLPEHNTILITAIHAQPLERRGWVYANFAICHSNGKITSIKSRPKVSADTIKIIYNLVSQDLFILPSACIICKKAFWAVGGFDAQFRGYEDDDLFIRMFLKGFEYAFEDQDVYIWRTHGAQTSSSNLMLTSRMLFIHKWFYGNHDPSIHLDGIRQSLYNRFKITILRDVLEAGTPERLGLAKKYCQEFSKTFYSNQKGFEKTAFTVFNLFPQKLLNTTLFMLKIFGIRLFW